MGNNKDEDDNSNEFNNYNRFNEEDHLKQFGFYDDEDKIPFVDPISGEGEESNTVDDVKRTVDDLLNAAQVVREEPFSPVEIILVEDSNDISLLNNHFHGGNKLEYLSCVEDENRANAVRYADTLSVYLTNCVYEYYTTKREDFKTIQKSFDLGKECLENFVRFESERSYTNPSIPDMHDSKIRNSIINYVCGVSKSVFDSDEYDFRNKLEDFYDEVASRYKKPGMFPNFYDPTKSQILTLVGCIIGVVDSFRRSYIKKK